MIQSNGGSPASNGDERPDRDAPHGGAPRRGAGGASGDSGSDAVGTSPINVNLPAFDGPLDLLLHLIKRDEINIYDIPISHITGEYLAYIGMMQLLDLEVAGDFLVMAASLMRIKARLLLPPAPGAGEEEEDGLDPRDELVRQLLEYRRFKEAAERLHGAEEQRRQLFERGFVPRLDADGLPELMPISLYALIDVMKDVLARVGEEFFHEVLLEEVSLEVKMELISGELANHGRVLFLELIERFPRRMHVVVTLMAVLEMARLGLLAVRQEKVFGQIWLYRAELAPPLEIEYETEAPAEPEGSTPRAHEDEGSAPLETETPEMVSHDTAESDDEPS